MKTKFYIILSTFLSFFIGINSSNGQAFCGLTQNWVQSCTVAATDPAMPSTALVQISLDPNVCSPTLTINMTGPVTVQRFGAQNIVASSGSCSHIPGHNDVIPTQIMSMSMIGTGPFAGYSLYAGTATSPGGVNLQASLGNIIESPGGYDACSYFDVYFEIKTPGGTYLYNHQPCRLESIIDRVPPLATYNSPTSGTCIDLFIVPVQTIPVTPPSAVMYGASHALTSTPILVVNPPVISPTPQCPPNTGPLVNTSDSVVFALDTPGIVFDYSGNNFVVTVPDLTHGGFSTYITPPTTIGASVTQNINASIAATFQGSISSAAVFAPGPFVVKMTKISGNLPDEGVYQTEILALDMSGGNLPPGVAIRESPTLASTGQTTITKYNGQYKISSGFHLNTEISVNGVNGPWLPQTSPAAHVYLRYYHLVPTVGQWGIIIFSLLLLALGVVLVRKRQHILVTESGHNEKIKPSMFDVKLYIKVLVIMLLFTAVCLAAANWYFNGVSMTDKLGTIISVCIASYITHLWILMREK